MKRAISLLLGSLVLALGLSTSALAEHYIYACPSLSGSFENRQEVSDKHNPDYRWYVVAQTGKSMINVNSVKWSSFQSKNTNQGYSAFCTGKINGSTMVHARLVVPFGQCMPYTNGTFNCEDPATSRR